MEHEDATIIETKEEKIKKEDKWKRIKYLNFTI